MPTTFTPISRARHHHRKRMPVSLADCVAATALTDRRVLATADPALTALVYAKDGEVMPGWQHWDVALTCPVQT